MNYLTAKQLSEKWGISERRIIKLCKEGRINGAIKNGMIWIIPEDTIKPSDKRSKISKYINTEKRAIIVNVNNDIGYNLIPLLRKVGYIVEGICEQKTDLEKNNVQDIKRWETNFNNQNEIEETLGQTGRYYDGLIIIDTENIIKSEMKETIINNLAKKMDCEGSIVLVNNKKYDQIKIESKLCGYLKENIGVRINSLNIDIPINVDTLMNYDEIAEDIVELLTKFKNTTGISITTDAGVIEFNTKGRTKPLIIGEFYRVINSYFKRLNKDSYMWSASTMLEDEWTEEPLEMNFRVINLEAANRGTKIDRIFLFNKSKIKEFKNNKTLKIYMQSNINTMFVDYDEILKKEPQLFKILKNGWDGIDKDTLIVDLPESSKERGYISKNTKEVMEAYKCFQKLKQYSVDLKEVLK